MDMCREEIVDGTNNPEYRAARQEKRARPQRKFVDVLKEDVWTAGVMEEDARGRVRWI